MNPYALNWGVVTPELYSSEKQTAVHVINHGLVSRESIERNISFIKGRINWFSENMPNGTKHEVLFDDRGQDITQSTKETLRSNLSGYTERVSFMSER